MRRIAAIMATVAVLAAAACTSDDKKPEAAPSATPSAASPSPAVSPTPPAGADIKGPLNILIAGIDNRESIPNWIPRSDAVMILHVNADLSKAYLTSLPRDLVVNIPAFPPAKFSGQRTKLTHAMMYGSRVPGTKKPSVQQGFQLMAKTVSAYTGIPKFDGGAVLTFRGLTKLVDALGGIDIYVDQKIVSIHRQPNGQVRPGCSRCEHGYSGPRMTYNVGNMHMVGWQALDYSRQRYTNGGDYTRQRHQRQVIEALVGKILQGDFLSNPTAIDNVVGALGAMLTVVGVQPVAMAYALRNLSPQTITQVGLPGSGAYSGGDYIGENLSSAPTKSYFQALRQDKLDAWAAANPKYVNVGSPQG